MNSKVGLVYSYLTEADYLSEPWTAFVALCVKEHLDSDKLSFCLSKQTTQVPTPYHCLGGIIYGGEGPMLPFPSCIPQY